MKYVVTGRIQPERAEVSFGPIQLPFQDDASAVISCDASQVTVVLNVPEIDGWISAKIMADDLSNAVVSSLGFSIGCGYAAEMIQVTEENGTPHVFGVRPGGALATENLSFEDNRLVFNRALILAGRDIFFRLALRDYMRAIVDVTDCATHCYRAIESIKAAFVLRSGVDRWDEMHAALCTNRDEITRTIKQYADPIRHGNWIRATPTDKVMRWEMLKLTRTVLAKYLDLEAPVGLTETQAR